MMTTLQSHIFLLQSFLSNSTSATPRQAAEAALRITEEAAQSNAPKHSITLAQTVLANISKTPCIPAIPHLLSICERDPFEVIDVFVLSSAAWKALVAAAITAPPEPHLAARIISCAALSATAMIIKCLQPSSHTSSEVVRTVKIAKFYCLNAARCSRAFLNSVQDLSADLLCAPFMHICDFLALSSFVLLFDNHALLPAHHELYSEVLPLVTNTLTTTFTMLHQFSNQDTERVVSRALESTGRHQKFATLHLPTPVLQLLAVLHAARCALRTKQQQDESQQFDQTSRQIVISLLIPLLFDCFNTAYEEIILFREQGSGAPFLDTVAAATADIFSTVELGIAHPDQEHVELDFLIEQVSSDNAICSHIAQEVLLQMASCQNSHDGWRDFIMATICACLRTSLAVNCYQTERWQRLAAELCVLYVREGKLLNNALSTSRKLYNVSQSCKGNPPTELLDDPMSILLIAELCQLISQRDADGDLKCDITQSQIPDPVLQRALEPFQLDATKLAEHARDLALGSTGYTAVNAISLLPRILDNTSACGAALSVLHRESSSPSMICTALNILDPAVTQTATIDSACTAVASAERRYGVAVCPAVSAFVSKAAHCLGETISLVHWQRLSALLEKCLITSQEDTELSTPLSQAMTGITLHYAATALSAISSTIRDKRQTEATLPPDILNDVEDALKRLENWRTGENGCDLEEERSLVRIERSWIETPLEFDPVDKTNALYNIRETRERLLEAASLLLDGSNRVCISEEVKRELLLVNDSIQSIARCHQPSKQ